MLVRIHAGWLRQKHPCYESWIYGSLCEPPHLQLIAGALTQSGCCCPVALLAHGCQIHFAFGLHAFREISPAPFPPAPWRGCRPHSARTRTHSSLNGHRGMGESSGKETKITTPSSLNLGKSTRVCISLKTIHRHFWSERNHAAHRGLETATEAQSHTVSFKPVAPRAGANQCTVY